MPFIMENNEKLLNALKWAVADMDMNQGDVGRILGLKQSAVSLILGGKRKVRQAHIKKVAKAVNLTPEELLKKSDQWNSATMSASLPPMGMQAQASNIIPYNNVLEKFQDKPQAESLIAALAEVETHDPHGFALISGMIHHCHDEIKKRVFEKKSVNGRIIPFIKKKNLVPTKTY